MNHFLIFFIFNHFDEPTLCQPAFCQVQRFPYYWRPLACPRGSFLHCPTVGFSGPPPAQAVLGLFEQGHFKLRDALSDMIALGAPSKASLVENLSLKLL